jgi:4-oxalocrotonate tautomerase
MPEVYVNALEGRTKEQKRALIKDITEAVVRNFNVPVDAILVEIIENSRDNKAKGGCAVQRAVIRGLLPFRPKKGHNITFTIHR